MRSASSRRTNLVLVILIGLAAAASCLLGHPASAQAQRAPQLSSHATAHGMPLPRLARLADAVVPGRATSRPGSFPFQSATSADGLITVHFYAQPPSFASDFFAMTQQALTNYIKPTLGYGLTGKANIYIYNSRDDFLAGAQPADPAITGAFTDFVISTIYMPFTDDLDGFTTLAHEMTHVAFHQQADVGHLQADYDLYPVWLDEGLAASDQPEYDSQTVYWHDQLQQSLANGQFIHIFHDFVWTYPSDPDTDNLSYAEARSFIKYLEATYGAARFHQFIAGLKNGDIVFAAELAFGADLQTLESQWEGALGLPLLQHAPPALPVAPSPAPFYTDRLAGIATQTRPFAVAGGSDWLLAGILLAAGGTGAILLGLGGARLRARRLRRRYFARQTAIALALPTSLLSGPPASAAPAAASAPAATPSPALPAAEKTRPLAGPPTPVHWSEQLAQLLAVPLVLGVGLLWQRFDPTQSWMRAFLASAVALLVLVPVLGALLVRAWRARRIVVSYVATLVVLLALAAGAAATGQQAGIAQGHAYDTATAYALAVQTLSDAHAPPADLVQVHTNWAIAAYQLSDFTTATAQYRAAIALAPTSSAARDLRAVLTSLTVDWGTKLADAQQYDQAVHVYAAQAGDASCDTPCRATLAENEGSAYLAWAGHLIVTRQVSNGLATLRTLIQQAPVSKAAATANLILHNSSGRLAAALAVGAGKGGDLTAMNFLLQIIALQAHDPLQAALASESDEPVTGQLGQVYLYKSVIHLYFLAFASPKDAAVYIAHTQADTSLFKVAAATDASAAFTVWLPTGYTYIAIWEAPAQGGHDYYFYWSGTQIPVQPFTPLTISAPLTA